MNNIPTAAELNIVVIVNIRDRPLPSAFCVTFQQTAIITSSVMRFRVNDTGYLGAN